MCYDAPKMDPSVAEATRRQTEIGDRMADLAERQFESGQELIDRYAPVYDQILDQNLESSRKAEGRADQQWAHYSENFMPLERQIAEEARTYDSEAETARRTGRAAATVQKQADAAAETNARRMASMGISPTSGRSTQSMTDQSNLTALAKAGAINQEANNTKMTGIALRQGAAQLGRGITGTSLAQAGMGVGAGQAAQGTMGAQTGQMAGAMAPATSLMQGASGAYGGAVQGGLGRFNAEAQSNQYEASSMGSNIGTIATIVGGLAMMSSKKSKKNVKPVDDDAALEAMREVPVKEWDYKPGQGDGGHHVGPMAEDMQAAAGDQVAPGGQQIDVISNLGMQHAAIRALDKRMQAFESGEGVKDAPAKQSKGGGVALSMEPIPL